MTLKSLAAIAAAALLTAGAGATTTVVAGGSGQRSLGINSSGPVGQTFLATDTDLTSFGFQLQTLNDVTNLAVTLTLRAGAGFDGAVLATRSLTPTGVPTARVPTFVDFDLTGTTLTIGQSYTALLSSDSARFAVVYGPDINLNTGAPSGPDAYAGGVIIARTGLAGICTPNGGICDTNFRFTATTPATAVPEPATWGLMIAGFGLVGAAARRRRPALA